MGHYWYDFVERLVPFTGMTGVVCKVGADQLLYTPFVINPLFLIFNAIWDGLTGTDIAIVKGIKEEFRRKWWPVLRTNLKVWPLVHLITFSIIPLSYRVVWVTAVGTLWSIFLSYVANDFKRK